MIDIHLKTGFHKCLLMILCLIVMIIKTVKIKLTVGIVISHEKDSVSICFMFEMSFPIVWSQRCYAIYNVPYCVLRLKDSMLFENTTLPLISLHF